MPNNPSCDLEQDWTALLKMQSGNENTSNMNSEHFQNLRNKHLSLFLKLRSKSFAKSYLWFILGQIIIKNMLKVDEDITKSPWS